MQEEETQVNGVAVIGNMKDVGWTQAKAVERNYMKIMTGLLQVHVGAVLANLIMTRLFQRVCRAVFRTHLLHVIGTI